MTPACMIPWISLWPKPSGEVYPCCAVDIDKINLGHLSTTTLEEAFKSPAMNDLRKKFMAGKLDETICKKCIDRESAQGSSMRTMINESYMHLADELLAKTNEDGSVSYFDFKFVDFVWSNKCNFRCVHCNPSVSSAIGSDPDFKAFYRHTRPTEHSLLEVNPKIMDQFLDAIDNVEMIHFNGGEPFMIEEHYEILDHLIKIQRTDVKLWIHTNGSMLQYKGRKVVDYLKHFSNVKISMSHDGDGKRGEFVRHGYNDKKFLKTLKVFKELNLHVETSTCVHALNIWSLPEMIEWYRSHDLWTGINVVTDPKYIAYDIHDVDTKKIIAEKLIRESNNKWTLPYQNKIVNIANNILRDKPKDPATLARLGDYLSLKRSNLQQDAWETFPEYRNFFTTFGWN